MWDVKYWRGFRYRGEIIGMVRKAPNMNGVGVCRRPNGRIALVQTCSRSSFRENPEDGVQYAMGIPLDDVVKAQILADTETYMVRLPNKVALGLYREGQGAWDWFIALTGLVLSVPALLGSMFAWAWTSWAHMDVVLWACYGCWFLGSRALELPATRRLWEAIAMGFTFLKQSTQDAYPSMEGLKGFFDKASERINSYMEWTGEAAVSGYQVFLVASGFLIIVGLLVMFRGELRQLWERFFGEPEVLGSGDLARPTSEEAAYAHSSPRTDALQGLISKVEALGSEMNELKREALQLDSPRGRLRQHFQEGRREDGLSTAGMLQRLDQVESLVRSHRGDGSGGTPRTKPPGSNLGGFAAAGATLGALGAGSGSAGAMCTGNLRGTTEGGEPVLHVEGLGQCQLVNEPVRLGAGGADTVGPGYLASLLKLAENTHELMVAELRRVRPIKEKDWPLPVGYRVRIAAAYLAWVFSRNRNGESYARVWL